MELKVETTTTANGRGERHHRATMRAMTSTLTFNGNGCEMIANNRTLVLMLSFVEALAKEDLFASSASGKAQQQTTSLVVVCQGILAYFAGESNEGEDDQEQKNFTGKSLVRQRAIETLAHLCLTSKLYLITQTSNLIDLDLSLLQKTASSMRSSEAAGRCCRRCWR